MYHRMKYVFAYVLSNLMFGGGVAMISLILIGWGHLMPFANLSLGIVMTILGLVIQTALYPHLQYYDFEHGFCLYVSIPLMIVVLQETIKLQNTSETVPGDKIVLIIFYLLFSLCLAVYAFKREKIAEIASVSH